MNKRKDLIKAMEELKKAFYEVETIIGDINIDEETENLFAENYPFKKDFFELSLEVYEWVDNFNSKLEG